MDDIMEFTLEMLDSSSLPPLIEEDDNMGSAIDYVPPYNNNNNIQPSSVYQPASITSDISSVTSSPMRTTTNNIPYHHKSYSPDPADVGYDMAIGVQSPEFDIGAGLKSPSYDDTEATINDLLTAQLSPQRQGVEREPNMSTRQSQLLYQQESLRPPPPSPPLPPAPSYNQPENLLQRSTGRTREQLPSHPALMTAIFWEDLDNLSATINPPIMYPSLQAQQAPPLLKYSPILPGPGPASLSQVRTQPVYTQDKRIPPILPFSRHQGGAVMRPSSTYTPHHGSLGDLEYSSQPNKDDIFVKPQNRVKSPRGRSSVPNVHPHSPRMQLQHVQHELRQQAQQKRQQHIAIAKPCSPNSVLPQNAFLAQLLTTASPSAMCSPPPITPAESTKDTSPSKPFSPKSDTERVQYKERKRVYNINAQHKRRGNIKNLFDRLNFIVPALAQNPNRKRSKATMLNEAVGLIRHLTSEITHTNGEIDELKRNIETLNHAINTCQSQLPATGAPICRQQANKSREMFDQYVRQSTMHNWKFWVFSLIMEQVLNSYNNSVSVSSFDDMCRTSLSWAEQHCSLVELRPAVLNSLRHLSTTTSVLTDPSRLPEEAVEAVTSNKNKTDSKC